MSEPKWKGCGHNGCVNGWVPATQTQTVRRFLGKWINNEDVGGDGKFVHPETGETTKFHWPHGPNDPLFETTDVPVDAVQKCPCHPTHWSLSA